MSENTNTPYKMTIEEPEPWKRVVKVEVSHEHFDGQYRTRLGTAAKSYSKPGFRKGKTPRAMVEKELGPQLRADTLEALVPDVFRRAVIEHSLSPITDPAVENLVFEEGSPIKFDMVMEVRPQIEAKDYDGLKLTRKTREISGGDVDQVLERLCESRAIFEKVDRASAEGDELLVDLTPAGEDGQFDPEKKVEGQKLQLGSPNNFPAFDEALTGVEAGDEKTIEVEYQDDHHNEELRGTTTKFFCTVREVCEKKLPELTDDFAATLQPGATLLELRTMVRGNLEKEEENRLQREMDEQIVDLLVEHNPLDVPPSLVKQYVDSGVEELHGRNAQSGRENTAEQDEQYAEMTRPIAERILKGMFIMESIRRQEKITVSDDQVNTRINEIAAESGYDVEKFREYASKGDERERIMHGLQERTTFDFLLSRAEIEDLPADEEAEETSD